MTCSNKLILVKKERKILLSELQNHTKLYSLACQTTVTAYGKHCSFI